MKIRVAYDISFLATFVNYPEGQSGVHRTVEELLFELCRRDDVEVTAVTACGADPLTDVVNSSLYVARHGGELACRFEPSLVGRFGLSGIYLRAAVVDAEGGSRAATGGTRRSQYHERARHLATRVVRKLDQPRLAFDRRRHDVFHSPFLKLPSRAVVGDIPRVLTVYDLIFLKNPEFMTPELVAFLQPIFDSLDIGRDWVTCISEFTKQEFCEYTGMSPERVFVTPLAAAEHFQPVNDRERIAAARRAYGIPEGDYFLALSTLQPRKNFPHLIRCFFRLLSEHPDLDVNLIIVGVSGWLFEEIFEASDSSARFRHRVVITGYVPNEDLSALYAGAVGFLFLSLYEGFGLPALEAMQCGTPVIASSTTAFPEVVGDAGLLVEPTDADALSQAMLDLLSDEGLRGRLSRKGLTRSKLFSWAACAEKTVHAYETAIEAV